jgi:DNA polymerase elongation subunit (family B)
MSTTWADRELVRIKALPNADVIIEVHKAMNGHTYSWRCIQRRLQRLDIDNNIYLDWIDLCKLKQTWDRIPSLTKERQHKDIVERLSRDLSYQSWNLKYLRMLLISLKLILIRAGIKEEEGIFL